MSSPSGTAPETKQPNIGAPPRLLACARAIAPQLIAWRRHLHTYPELSGQEEQTAAFIASQLRQIGYPPRERVGGGFGLVAELSAGAGGAVALRADFDALPIAEDTGLPFASKHPGIMHACGHDAHTAMLLGAAVLLRDRQSALRRPVRLVFQPHEEVFPGGAQAMIADGVLEGVAQMFGLHIWSQLPTGKLGFRAGAFMSAINDLVIRIVGSGGHAAIPDQCVDPIVAAAHVITALQTAVTRSISLTDRVVVSVTQFHGGNADNIIPGEVVMRGTIRSLDEPARQKVVQRVREIATSVAAAMGARAEVEILPGYPVLTNDPGAVEELRTAARQVGFAEENISEVAPLGGGEDFAYYTQRVPAAFVLLGGGNAEKNCTRPHHHPGFDIDEDALPLGAALLAQAALGSN